MQDLSTTTTSTMVVSSTIAQNQGFDTSVNGHDYLRSIIQLPIYLQLNLSKTKQMKKTADGFSKKRQNVRYDFFFLFEHNSKNIFLDIK